LAPASDAGLAAASAAWQRWVVPAR
jgi:hypothetical protein